MAILIFAGIAIAVVVVPLALLSTLGTFGVSTAASPAFLEVGGLLLAALAAFAYLVRPSRAYGPALAARATAGMLYLVLLAPYATAHVTVRGDLSATFGGSELVLWLAIVPAIGLLAAVFVILSDARDPFLRLRREFPG